MFDEPDDVLWELSNPNLDYDLIEESAFHHKGIGIYENTWGLPNDYSEKKYDKTYIKLCNSSHSNKVKLKREKAIKKEILPSKYTDDYWIRAYSPRDSTKNSKQSGKWLSFVPKTEIDAAWEQVKDATELGLLGPISKVSTKLGEQGSEYVICIYTKDWKDERDVMRVRERLRELGFEKPMPYKTDADTIAGKYACKGIKNISKYFE